MNKCAMEQSRAQRLQATTTCFVAHVNTMQETARILIVEEQIFVAADCEQHLTNAGFACVGMASTASTALELAAEHRPDVILMDINLADGGDGVDVATAIYRTLGIRCVFASGQTDRKSRLRASAACPFGWLEKPYTADALLCAVNSAVAELSAPDPDQAASAQESATNRSRLH